MVTPTLIQSHDDRLEDAAALRARVSPAVSELKAQIRKPSYTTPGDVSKRTQRERSMPNNREMKMPQQIVFDSPELACFHEAGHAAIALGVGARVEKIVLYREEPRSHGRTSVHRDENQRRPIALGGFAAEYSLYKTGRLVKQDGGKPSQKEFIDYAINNANDDRIAFFNGDFRQPDGYWPIKKDSKFMYDAMYWADRRMSFAFVEQVAAELLSSDELDGDTVTKIAATHPPLVPEM